MLGKKKKKLDYEKLLNAPKAIFPKSLELYISYHLSYQEYDSKQTCDSKVRLSINTTRTPYNFFFVRYGKGAGWDGADFINLVHGASIVAKDSLQYGFLCLIQDS